MATVSVYNTDGKEVEKIDLSDNIFGVEINETLVHKAVVAHLANRRQGTQSALTRSEVRGGKASAANLGVHYARGKYIVHLDADSSLDRDAIEKILIPFYYDSKGV